ncbi:MAG TPA: efflux RND transporter periplasmic adaptor subunit [Vicinamibacterales bacterium]|nr:efflux RND transporter periplasmic adaptor subunit [Vicinamibacterales bacterium]
MRRFSALGLVASLALAGAACNSGSSGTPAPAGGPGMGGRGGRPPMPVEFTPAKRSDVAERVTIVGTLIGAATVEAVPKVNGRLESVSVRLGDRVNRGQQLAKVEDREIREQVRQAEASYRVAEATIRQRQADLKLAETNLERNRSLLERELLPRQTFDDTEARHQAAVAQLDLARAQFEQAKARLDELRINLANTVITSPVEGFVGKRYLDPGAFVSPNAPVASIVDIRSVRMVANVVEKDVRRLSTGMSADVEVDAFPGERFVGKVSRIAPVFDPQTRTAEMEIEVPNGSFRLKPGMYARVALTIDRRENALTVPRTAVVELDGRTGVFVAGGAAPPAQPASNPPPAEGPRGAQGAAEPQGTPGAQDGPGAGGAQPAMTAKFQPVQVGIRDGERVEITAGIEEGARVITTGASALKDGDRIVPASTGRRGRGGQEPQGADAATSQGAPAAGGRQGSTR